MFFDKLVKAFQGGAEDASKIFHRVVSSIVDGEPHYAGHCALWKVENSVDRSSGLSTSTWTLDVRSLRQRFHGDGVAQCDILLTRIKNGVKWLTKVRHPGILQVVSPLKEEKNGDLVFVSERVTCSLAGRMSELKKVRSIDSWSLVAEQQEQQQQQQQQQAQQHQQRKNSNSSQNRNSTTPPPKNKAAEEQNHHDPIFGSANNTPFQTRAQQHGNNSSKGNSGNKKQQQQISIEDDLFGPPVSAAQQQQNNQNSSTSSSSSPNQNNKNSSATTSSSLDQQQVPHESNINMDALDDAEVLVLLRSVATALQFLHSNCQAAHLNLSPESIVVIRGNDHDTGLNDKKLPSHLQQERHKKTSNNSSLNRFKETWKICDFTFACALAELDSIPAKYCDHFVKVGGVRNLSSSGNNTRNGGGGDDFLFGGGSSGSNNNKNNHDHNNSNNNNNHSALVNRLLAPSLDYAAPEYVLQNKPGVTSDVFSFVNLSFAVLRAAAEIPSEQKKKYSHLPRNLNASNDIAMYQSQLASILQEHTSTSSWGGSSSSTWISAIQMDKNSRPESIAALLKANDALADPGALALEQSEQINYLDTDGKNSAFFQLHKSLPTFQNGTLLRRVFPILAIVTDSQMPELHRYIAPLAISSSFVVASHLKIFSGRGAAGPAVADALSTIVAVFRTLFASGDMHCAIVLLEEHEKLVPAVVTVDEFTRNESSFFSGPTPGWISTFQGQHRDLTRSYIDLVLKAVRCDTVTIATPGVGAASTLMSELSCGNDVTKEVNNNRNNGSDDDHLKQAKREDIAFAETLVPIVAMHAFGMAACNVGEEVRNSAAAATTKFVKSIVDDRAKLIASGQSVNNNQHNNQRIQEKDSSSSSDTFSSAFGSFFGDSSPFNNRSGGGGGHNNSNHHQNNNGGMSPLQISVERRANVVRETLFPQLVKLQGAMLISCSQIQQRNWVLLVSACGKLMRPQEVAGAVLGMLGSALVDGRLSNDVAGVVATELQGIVAHMIQSRNLK